MVDTAPLFDPLQVGQKTLRNRIVMPPMVVMRGVTTPEGAEWYGRRALGGVGLVIVEATGVTGFGAAYTAKNLRPLVDAIHAGGALAAIQLFPGTFGQDKTRPPADLIQDSGQYAAVGHAGVTLVLIGNDHVYADLLGVALVVLVKRHVQPHRVLHATNETRT